MIDEALRSPNVRAFLRAIRLGEGTSVEWGYRLLVGGGLVDNLRDHPRRRVWVERYNVWSTAAGAYQFLERTWDEMAVKYSLPDFSPESQDKAAVGLLIRRKALDDVLAGRIESAIRKCRQEWASLPGSPYGQRTESLDAVLDEYTKWGGQQAPAPITRKDTTMSPFLIAALPALVEAIPGLIRNFGKGAVTERNAQAAQRVLEIVQIATNTSNAQAAVEAVKDDPAMRVAATEALDREGWFVVTEAGGGGIAGARKFNAEVAKSDNWLGAGWAIVLGVLAVGVVIGGGTVMGVLLFDAGIDKALAAQILDYYKAAGFIVLGYAFGSSVSSRRKDDALVRSTEQQGV